MLDVYLVKMTTICYLQMRFLFTIFVTVAYKFIHYLSLIVYLHIATYFVQFFTKTTMLLSVFSFWQDAHEFLNFLLNELVDILEKEAQASKTDPETPAPSEKVANGFKNGHANGPQKEPLITWVHKNFQVTCLPIYSCLFFSLLQ